uniref:Putative salivary secreted peptide n=1 Tax=Oncopeltus fasciatus TaxID=7536 RepID=A3FK53_ONCFA|nr:putative salivary secreted peptide [Oncopeltus fasciatus]
MLIPIILIYLFVFILGSRQFIYKVLLGLLYFKPEKYNVSDFCRIIFYILRLFSHCL